MAKRRRRTRKDMAAVLRRNIAADGWLPKYRAAMRGVLDSMARDVARAIRAGQSPAAWRKRLERKWAKQLARAKRVLILDMVVDGYMVGDDFFEDGGVKAKAGVAGIEGKQTRTSFENEILSSTRLRADVEKYINETSKLESAGSAARFGRYQEIAAATQMTVAEQASAFMAKGLALNKTRAELMARTTTIWAYNEGAAQNYVDQGVAAMEWVATIDAATDPECANADGEQRKIGEPFSTGTLHPPVHPNCCPAGTSIHLRSSYQAIEDIKVGDEVWTHKDRLREVTALMHRHYDGELVCIDGAKMTPEHPVWADGYWIEAQHLKSHDMKSFPREKFSGTVYNFSVEEDESYIADCITVHNCRCAVVPVVDVGQVQTAEQEARRVVDRGGVVEAEAAAQSQRWPKPATTDAMTAWGERGYKDVKKVLSAGEQRALTDYQLTTFRPINRNLRRGIAPREALRSSLDDIPSIEKAISKTTVPSNIVTYRGASYEYADELRGKAIKGAIIEDAGFMSTSLNKELVSQSRAGNAGVLMEIRVPKGTKGMWLDSVTGGGDKPEWELLLQRNTALRVIDAKSGQGPRGQLHIIAEVVAGG